MAFNGRFALNIAHQAALKGADLEEVLSLSGKTSEELCDEACMIEDEAYNALVEKAIELSVDPLFGLHAGEALNLSAAGLIAQVVQTSPTVKAALDYCCQFANLGCSVLPMSMELKGDSYKVMLTPNEDWKRKSPISFQHTAEGVLAFTVKEFHSLTRLKYYPEALYLPWELEGNISEYKRVFGCEVYFGTKEIAMFLKRSHVEQPVVSSDYSLLQILVAHAEQKNAELSDQVGFASLVKQSVIKLVKPEFPSLQEVAGHLNISPRTLQRKLKEEGVVYKELIDELKKDFALQYLKRKDLNISDVAYLLSYSDVSAFNKAFKRWTGGSASEVKREF